MSIQDIVNLCDDSIKTFAKFLFVFTRGTDFSNQATRIPEGYPRIIKMLKQIPTQDLPRLVIAERPDLTELARLLNQCDDDVNLRLALILTYW